jgi:hypothetical protein
MKVDKAVCTSNDFAGNTPPTELNSIIKFETVFTTLVENKILAIKRECEEHENKKKSRTFKGILSKKSTEDGKKNGIDSKKKNSKNFFLRHKNKLLTDVDVEKGEKVVNEHDVELAKVEVQHEVQGLKKEPANIDSQRNDFVKLPVSKIDESTIDGPKICDNSLDNSKTEKAQLSLSTTNSSDVNSNNTIKEPSPSPQIIPQNDESLATTIDISLQQQSSVIEQIKVQPINNNNDKSDVAICDDVSSQNTSDIEFSLVSESISEPPHIRKKVSTNSDPILKKPAHFLSPPLSRDAKVVERKSISCQSTPLFGRHSNKGDGEVKKVLTFQKELPKKVSEPAKTIEKVKSQTIVIAPNSTTTTTTLAKPLGPAETVHTSRKSQKHSKYRDVSVEYEISYDDDDGNQSNRGFFSSFNQLTSQLPPTAVITSSNPKKQSSKQSKVHSTKEVKNQQEALVNTRKVDDKTAKHHEIELELDELQIDVVNKKKKRRSEFGLVNFFL